ncbi:hypothetical protein [Nannocystis pusilla]|uniref:hypothetical protein n=1 Tax=Nannocystis pusilla TaxID=889268 RepID=UPI003B7FA6D4
MLPFPGFLETATAEQLVSLDRWYHLEDEVCGRVYQPLTIQFSRERRRNDRGHGCWRWVGYYSIRGAERSGEAYGPRVEAAAVVERAEAVRETYRAALDAVVVFAGVRCWKLRPSHDDVRRTSLVAPDLTDVPEEARVEFQLGARLRFLGPSDETPPAFSVGDELEVIGFVEGCIALDCVRPCDGVFDMVHYYEVELIA